MRVRSHCRKMRKQPADLNILISESIGFVSWSDQERSESHLSDQMRIPRISSQNHSHQLSSKSSGGTLWLISNSDQSIEGACWSVRPLWFRLGSNSLYPFVDRRLSDIRPYYAVLAAPVFCFCLFSLFLLPVLCFTAYSVSVLVLFSCSLFISWNTVELEV